MIGLALFLSLQLNQVDELADQHVLEFERRLNDISEMMVLLLKNVAIAQTRDVEASVPIVVQGPERRPSLPF